MAVRPCRPADLPALHELFNGVIEPLCHGFPSTRDEFVGAFRGNPPYLRSSVVLVSETAGRLTGFARAGIFQPVPDRHTLASAGDGLVFGPFFGPPHFAEGQALLSAATAYLADHGAVRMSGFDPVESLGVPFYNGGWAGLSERLPHVVGLYARAGFRVTGREFCLTRPAMPCPPAVDPPAQLRIVHEVKGRNRFAVKLMDGSLQAGDCHCCRMYPTRSGRDEALDWGYVDGLGVSEPYRGRGLGRLLMGQAMNRLRAIGCGPVCLTTGGENYRAQNLYYSLGFALLDSCVTMVRNGA